MQVTQVTTLGQLQILRHTLGLDSNGHGTAYRNHFVTGPGTQDYADCMALTERGFMTRRAGNAITGGDDVFYVTPAGKEFVTTHRQVEATPKALPLSKRKYRHWLRCASDVMTFGEWLRTQYAKDFR